MNDRYLFRGQRVDNGEWVVGSLLVPMGYCTTFRIVYEDLEGFTCEKEVIPETVGQYTTLKDKNGKLIFEGDIIKAFRQIEPPMIDLRKLENIPDDERFIFRIDYKKDSCCYVFTILKKFSDGDIDCYHRNIIPYYEVDELNKDSIEVIGNIHQNSELLEKGGK
jgi:uncharacterized phage protein (TIGR01671 family)